MKRALFTLLAIIELMSAFSGAQQVSSQPVRDSAALSVLNKAVTAVGGVTALSAIQDYTAAGSVAFQLDQLVTGQVTLTGRGTDFRIDAALQNGTETWYILKGQGVNKGVDGSISALSYQQIASIQSFNFPILQIASALTNASVNVSYLGTAVRLGEPVVGVRIRTLSVPYFATDARAQLVDKNFYFDSTKFLLVTVEDLAFPSGQITSGIPHQVQFSNYQQVQGVVVPFSIADSIGNQGFTAITLTQISFNAGYSDSQFEP